MRGQLNHADDRLDAHKRAMLDLLVEEHQGVWSVEELDRHAQRTEALRDPDHRPTDTEDVLQQLSDQGLVHRFGRYACATRAAAAAVALGR